MDRQKKPGYSGHPGHPPRHKGMRHGGNFIYEVSNAGSRRLNRISNIELFLTAFLAGGFMSLGCFASVLLTTDVSSPSIQYLLQGIGLTIGLLLVILMNAALFTEANVFVPNNFYKLPAGRGALRLLRFWLITWIGNILGAFLFAYLIYLTQNYSDVVKQNLTNIVTLKLFQSGTSTYRSIFSLIISGILSNSLIALVNFFALASRNLINQCIIILLVLIAVTAANFQYFPINLGYFSLNTFIGNKISLMDIFFYNLIPVAIGNIIGACLFVAAPFLALAKKR